MLPEGRSIPEGIFALYNYHLHQLYRCLLRGRERMVSPSLPLKMASGIARPCFRGGEAEGSNHLHQLYRCLLRGSHLPHVTLMPASGIA